MKLSFHPGYLLSTCALLARFSWSQGAGISCQDSLSECDGFFQDKNRCLQHRAFAIKYCTQTCNLCPTSAPSISDCTDTLSDCRVFLTSLDDCDEAGGIFNKYCSKSCGKCECKDILPDCNVFVTNKALCVKGKLFHKYCAQTCGACGLPDLKPKEEKVCVDELGDCELYVKDSEDCKTNVRFFTKYCAKTCGLCGKPLSDQSHSPGSTNTESTKEPVDSKEAENQTSQAVTHLPQTQVPTLQSECKDLLQECRGVVKNHPDYCRYHVTYMKQHCARACNYCGSDEERIDEVEHQEEDLAQDDCKDNNGDCEYYARKEGYCSYQREFMEKTCPKACGFCNKVFHFSIKTTWNGVPINHEPVQISLSAQDASSVRLDVTGPLFNDPGPPPCTAGQACDGLWDYEVAEVFFLGEKEKYLEVEVCPHGQHLVLLLNGVRKAFKTKLPLKYTAHKDQANNRWNGTAIIPISYFPPMVGKINAYAIHGSGQQREYQALYPATGTNAPDFHRLEFFQDFDFKAMFPALWSQPTSVYYN